MKVDRIKTQGIAVFRTSTDASVVVDDLHAFVDRMNKEVLTRGVPQDLLEEAAQITEWRVEGAEIRFLIKTGRRVRAHAAALRIRKQLAPLLGSKRIGIRGLSMLQYTVEMTFDSPLPSNLSERIARISYVVKVNQRDATLRAVLTDLRDRDLERGVPDRIVSLIEKLVIESTAPARRPTPIIIMRGAERPIRFNKDPAQVAVELGWIKEFPGRGQWIYTPPFAELIYAIESLLMEHIVRKLGFQPFFLPKLIPLEVMKRMPGYLTSIPEGMYYVCPPPRDPEAFARFKERAFVEDEVDRVELRKVLKDPDYVLAPAQCEPFWQFLAGEVLDVNKLPYRFFDASGWTYRWEGGGVEGLVRLQEFRRIELVYVGTPEQVVRIRRQILDQAVFVVDKLLDLEWRVTAEAPFYVREAVEIDTSDESKIPALDLEVYLPYRGPRDKESWLEIAGCFVHQRKFVESFHIKEARGREIWTGCTGLGVSRWVAGFLAQHGFNPENWPLAVRERYRWDGFIPEMLTWPRKKREYHVA